MKIKTFLFSSLIFTSFLCTPLFSSESATEGRKYLDQTSKAFNKVGKKAIPAVVYIEAEVGHVAQNIQGLNGGLDNPMQSFIDEFLKDFIGQRHKQLQQPQPRMQAGSGFFISKDGYIVTNSHVVRGADRITVFLNNGDELEGKLIGTDPSTDIGVVKVEGKDFDFLEFGNAENIEVGEWVVAIGSPFSLRSSLTTGVVSAIGRKDVPITELGDYIQTDAVINPGSSGGPLLNLDAKVIGVNTAVLTTGGDGGYKGICFAIPCDIAKTVSEQIIQHGSFKRGYLGILLQPIDKAMAEALNLSTRKGSLIAEVAPGSPADKGGLKQGDVIISYNGHSVSSHAGLRNAIAFLEPGSKINLVILREGKEKDFNIVLGTPSDKIAAAEQTVQLGIEVSELKEISPQILRRYGYDSSTPGVIVSSVKPGSLAERAGIQPGTLILQVGRKKIASTEEFYAALNENNDSRHLLLLTKFQKTPRFITIRVK